MKAGNVRLMHTTMIETRVKAYEFIINIIKNVVLSK